jgi:hypothetical protein
MADLLHDYAFNQSLNSHLLNIGVTKTTVIFY